MFYGNQCLYDINRLRLKAEKLILNQPNYQHSEPEYSKRVLPPLHSSHSAPLDSTELIQELNIHQMELKIQNEELRRAQEQHENLLREYVGLYYDFAPCGYVTLSPKGIITRINLSGSILLKTERLNLKCCSLSSFIAEPCHMNYFMSLKQAARTGEKQSAELKLKSDGKWVIASIQPDMEDSGELRQWRVTLSDISVYKQEAILLKEREERFRFIFENAPFACHFLNSNGEIIEVNSCWEKLTGHSRGKVLGKNFTEFIHPNWRDSFQKSYSHLKALNGDDTSYFQVDMVKEDGTLLHVALQAKPCRDKNMILNHACFCFHPLPELNQEENSLPQPPSQSLPNLCVAKMHEVAIMDNLPGSLMKLDTTGRIICANRGCCTMLEIDPDTIEGQFFWDIGSNQDDNIKQMKEWIRNTIDNLPLPKQLQMKFRSRSGKILTLQTEWNYSYNQHGRVDGILLNMADISEITESKFYLKQTVDYQNEKLTHIEQEIEKKSAAINVLTQQLNNNNNNNNNMVEERVMESLKSLILPYIDRLKSSSLNYEQKRLLAIVEANMSDITSHFAKKMKEIDCRFTPMEIQIAHMVKQGKTNKEIAPIFSISSRTVDFHRDNLRRKLGIKNKKANLRSFLLSSELLQAP